MKAPGGAEGRRPGRKGRPNVPPPPFETELARLRFRQGLTTAFALAVVAGVIVFVMCAN